MAKDIVIQILLPLSSEAWLGWCLPWFSSCDISPACIPALMLSLLFFLKYGTWKLFRAYPGF
jgi:hypothetical protein